MKTGAVLLVLGLLVGTSTQEPQFECGKIMIDVPYNYPINEKPFPGRWPWQGIVYHRKPDRALEFVCGCTLISDKHVITSELCMRTENGSLVDSKVLFVRLGSYEHNLLHFGNARYRRVRKIHQPTGYYEMKIVILELTKKVKFNDYVQPICVSQDEEIDYMVGWVSSQRNRKMQLYYGTKEECNFGEFFSYYDHTEICREDRGSIGLVRSGNFYFRNVYHLSAFIDCTRSLYDPCKELSIDNKVNQISLKGYLPWIGAVTKLEYLQKVRQGRNFDPSKNYPQLLPQNNCGHIFVDHNDHDQNAQLYEYPWIARVVYRKGGYTYSDDQPGALISYRYVLTAAENVYSPYNERIKYVKLGEYDSSQDPDCNADDENDCAPPVRYYDVEYIVIHPNFNTFSKKSIMYNIALIRTTDIIAYEDHIHPVCLPVTEELRQLKQSDFLFAGWNMIDEDEGSSSILQHATFSKCIRNQTQNAVVQSDLLMCPNINDFIWWSLIVGTPLGKTIDYNGMRFVQFAINLAIYLDESFVHTPLDLYINWIIANIEE